MADPLVPQVNYGLGGRWPDLSPDEKAAAADLLFSGWIDAAPRFGAVAAHFPKSLRKRFFVASFWAPELFFSSPDGREAWYRDLPESPRTRAQLDSRTAHLVGLGRKTCRDPESGSTTYVPARQVRFWSPELPEVAIKHLEVSGEPGRWLWTPILFLLLLCLALPAGAQTLFGVVTKVTDGDTLTVGKTRVRLSGIDAPERKQMCDDARGMYACGAEAKLALLALAPVGSSVSCQVQDVDRYGRLVAVCSAAQRAGSDLSREMVLQGWAVAYRKYSLAYARDEEVARAARRGIWSGTFVQPAEWRKGVR